MAFSALPAEVPAGAGVPVWVDMPSDHPSDQLVLRRFDAGREYPSVRAAASGAGAEAGSKRWLAELPPLADGERMAYAPTLIRSGLIVATLPTRSLTGAPRAPMQPAQPAEPDPNPTQKPKLATGHVPRYQWASEFLGALTIQLAKPPESFGPVPEGLNVTFYIASGEIRGPRMNAKVRGEGGDWMLVRRDGVGSCDVRITYETDDGALILSRYYGIFDLGANGYERALRQEYDPVPPLVLAPRFTTSHPNWLWLNRLQCLAVGRVTMADLIVRFDLYAIRAGEPLPSCGLPAVHAPPLIGDIHP